MFFGFLLVFGGFFTGCVYPLSGLWMVVFRCPVLIGGWEGSGGVSPYSFLHFPLIQYVTKMIPEKIKQLSSAAYTSFAFLAGMKLSLFTILSQKQSTPKHLAKTMSVKEKHIERLLYALVSVGLLRLENGKFLNTEEAEQYLVKGKPDYLGNHVYVNPGLNYGNWGSAVHIADSIRTGEPQDFYDFTLATYEQHLETFRGTMPVAVKAGEDLAKWFDFTDYRTVVDIGGASGGLALSLVKAYPHLEAKVADLPSIVPVARTLLSEAEAETIEVFPCDIVESPLQESFDVAVLRAVIQVLSPEQAEKAVRHVAESINSGGCMIILGHVLDNSRISPVEEVGMNLIYLNWGYDIGCYTRTQYLEWMLGSGLIDVRFGSLPNGDRIITAKKP